MKLVNVLNESYSWPRCPTFCAGCHFCPQVDSFNDTKLDIDQQMNDDYIWAKKAVNQTAATCNFFLAGLQLLRSPFLGRYMAVNKENCERKFPVAVVVVLRLKMAIFVSRHSGVTLKRPTALSLMRMRMTKREIVTIWDLKQSWILLFNSSLWIAFISCATCCCCLCSRPTMFAIVVVDDDDVDVALYGSWRSGLSELEPICLTAKFSRRPPSKRRALTSRWWYTSWTFASSLRHASLLPHSLYYQGRETRGTCGLIIPSCCSEWKLSPWRYKLFNE